jgi:predicted RNA-binding protein with PUA-like domain
MNYWLVKSEPESYSFEQLRKDKTTAWTGVRNFTARNNLKAMAKGDRVFFYHSVTEKAVVGLATVVKTAYRDPTVEPDEKGGWLCVDLKFGQAFEKPVSLEEIKLNPKFKETALLKLSRLSVQSVEAEPAAELMRLGGVS